MANRRDNFTPKTKELLAKRAGYLCSNPNCRKPTIGATLEPNKWKIIKALQLIFVQLQKALHEWKKDAANESMTRLAVVGTSQVRAYDIALRSTLFCKSPGRKPSRSPASTAGRVRISVLCAMLRSSSFPG